MGLVHVDAHADTSDVVLGEKIGHGTPFRRCVEEGLLDCKRVVQIGLRGSGYSADSYEWSRAQVLYFITVDNIQFWKCIRQIQHYDFTSKPAIVSNIKIMINVVIMHHHTILDLFMFIYRLLFWAVNFCTLSILSKKE